MTALHQYSRLEAPGLWRRDPSAQRREVIVGLRKATIVLLDPKSEMPLAQWSLPAIQRLGTFEGFVTYATHEDADETLEIDDVDMIAALDRVRGALDRRRKRPGRLRSVLMVSVISALIGAGAIWVPLGIYGFTARRLPDAARREIAASAMRDIATISGSPCSGTSGVAAAADLARRVALGADPTAIGNALPTIGVVREGLTAPATLPDGTILLPYSLVEAVDGPDTLAGIVLVQRLRANQADPLLPALRHAGIMASFRLLSSGALPEGALQGYGLAMAESTPAALETALLHGAFVTAQITSQPYAAYAGDTELAALPDAAPQGSTPIVLDDAAFLGLQYMCDQ